MFKTILRKMKTQYKPSENVQYFLGETSDGATPWALNERLGKKLSLEFSGDIICLECGRKSKKSFNQGYCFPCSRGLARLDMCSVRPELCHYAKGTCREPEWGVANCMIPHTLYLANSSGLKVGITRAHQRVTRWIDQGAVEALPILELKDRLTVGLLETKLKTHFADRTNWRNMLKGEIAPVEFEKEKQRLIEQLEDKVGLMESEIVRIQYPVLEHPKKIVSLNLDKTPKIEGTLIGIKGQYLIFDVGVINIRSYSGYEVLISGDE